MYEIHNLMYFYHRIYPASGPCRKGNEPITNTVLRPYRLRLVCTGALPGYRVACVAVPGAGVLQF